MIVAKYQGFGAALAFSTVKAARDYAVAAMAVVDQRLVAVSGDDARSAAWAKARMAYGTVITAIDGGQKDLAALAAQIAAANAQADAAKALGLPAKPSAPKTPAPPSSSDPPPEHTTTTGEDTGWLEKLKQQPMLAAGVGLAAVALIAIFWPKGRSA